MRLASKLHRLGGRDIEGRLLPRIDLSQRFGRDECRKQDGLRARGGSHSMSRWPMRLSWRLEHGARHIGNIWILGDD